MRVSDYFVKYLQENGVTYLFGLQGSGTAMQMFDSIAKCDGIDYVCCLHEEAVGMAANGYAQMTKGLAVAIATAGPGATNLYTCVTGSWENSVPVLYIVGNPPVSISKKDAAIRFFAFQENDILSGFKNITKYISRIENAEKAKYEIQKAVHIAMKGRPGPVVLILPDDITWLEIDPDKLEGFSLEKEDYYKAPEPAIDEMKKVLQMINISERPVIIPGQGVKFSRAEKELKELSRLLQWPVTPTWGMRDVFAEDDPFYAGAFGVQGTRAGNFTVQNADLLLVIGSRLDRSETGNDPTTFARAAKIIYVDIDEGEILKAKDFNLDIALAIQSDAKRFISELLDIIRNTEYSGGRYKKWIEQVEIWKNRYPLFTSENVHTGIITPYSIIDVLSEKLGIDAIIVSDISQAQYSLYQSFRIKEGQRMIAWLNFGCLGYCLPASIGVSYAAKNNPVIAIMGDGGLQFNIQELATIIYNNRNIKIIIFDNDGYGNISRSQDRYLEGNYQGVNRNNGLPLPDISKIARAYGLKTISIEKEEELDSKIKEILLENGPIVCIIKLLITHWTSPMRVGDSPLEDMSPKLSRDELRKEMLIDVLE